MKKRSNFNTIKSIFLLTRIKHKFKFFFDNHNLNEFSMTILFFLIYFNKNISQYKIAKIFKVSPQRVNSTITNLRRYNYIEKTEELLIPTFKGKRAIIELHGFFDKYEKELKSSLDEIDNFSKILTVIAKKELLEDFELKDYN